MKYLSTSIRNNQEHLSASMTKLIPVMAASVRDIVAALSALLAASALMVLFIWAAGMNISIFMGAGTWALGFIFLGLALDNHGRCAVAQTITGVALLALALLQSRISPDFAIVSGMLLAGWVGFVLFRYLSRQDG